MKIIYSNSGKYVLDDKVLAQTEQAVQRADQLLKEAGWVPSLEIYVPYTRYAGSFEGRQGMHPTGQVIIKIKPDSDVDDSAPENISRYLLGQLPTGRIKVDIGEYGYEGWNSLIEHEDLRNLPDTYFTMMFISCIVEPSPITPLPNLQEVERQHWRPLAERIYEEVGKNLEEHDYTSVPEYKERAKKLQSVTESFLNSETGLEDLIRIIQEFP